MNRSKAIKAKRKLVRKNQKRIGIVVEVVHEFFDDVVGITATGKRYGFLTNFNKRELPLYKETIRRYKGCKKFAIGTETWGLDEDEGPHLLVGYDLLALYVQGAGDLTDFWNLYDNIRKEKFPNSFY